MSTTTLSRAFGLGTRVSTVTSTAPPHVQADTMAPTAVARSLHHAPRPYDAGLLLAVLALVGLGIVMVYSASVGVADMRFGDPTKYLRQHLRHVALAMVALMLGMSIPYTRWRTWVYPTLLGAIAMLVAVLAGAGINRGYSSRWLNLYVLEFQPSEVAKLAFVIYLAYSLEKKHERLRSFLIGFLPHLIVCGVLAGLCLFQPDLGTCIVLAGVMFAMLWVAGTKSAYTVGLVTVAAWLAFIYLQNSARWKRVGAWLDPYSDRYGSGFQVVNSLISIGSGGTEGMGLGMGRQKMGFLTQGFSDFMFSSIGEELGLIGCAAVIAIFGYILWRGYRVAVRAPDHLGRYLAFGVTVLICFQATFNMSVSVGFLPTKGLNLPFVSGGGSSLMVTAFAIGILLNVSRYAGAPQHRLREALGSMRLSMRTRQDVESRATKATKERKPIKQRDSGIQPFVRPSNGGGRA